MLLELTVHNIALIESLQLEFMQGFNVLTGETGSGKSIVVDCLNLVLGGRADRELVRTGMERGMVQALFDTADCPKAKAFAEDLGADCSDGVLIISREINRSGRNICRVCGVVVPLSTLKTLTGMLLDIHGQHDHQSLMNPANHIHFLDSFGDAAYKKLLAQTAELHTKRAALVSSLKKKIMDASEKERLVDMLTFQLNEISTAKLKNGEEEKIESKLRVLENAEKIRTNVEMAYVMTYRGTGKSQSAQEALMNAESALRSIEGIDPHYAEIAVRLHEVYDNVMDIGYELQDILEHLEFDPTLIEKLSKRLDLIDKLERKYGPKVEDVLAFGEKARTQLESIQTGDERIAEGKKELKALDAQLRSVCEQLTNARRILAEKLSAEIMHQLSDLGMSKTRFSIEISALPKPMVSGCDNVEFLISPNPGEPLRPMATIASGGELSRIMLALKTISMDVDGIPSMVFDEIDTGVSGRMAQVVGEKMCGIGKNHQVLCVTHLPQIAALGNAHYMVEKQTDGEHTHTDVTCLDDEGRIRELSRLVGDGEDSVSSLAHAQKLLENAALKRERLQGKA